MFISGYSCRNTFNLMKLLATKSQILEKHTAIKQQYPNAIVLQKGLHVRQYLAVNESAATVSEVLKIELLTRKEYVFCGFDSGMLETNLIKLINAGYTVAIVEEKI